MILQSICWQQSNVSKLIADNPLVTLLDQKCSNMKELKQIHAQMIKSGIHRDTISMSRVLAFTATHPAGDIHYALAVFDRIETPNLFTWNTIIRGFSQSSSPHFAILLFIQMLMDSTVKPHRLTYPSLFKACARMGPLPPYGAQIHARVKKLALDDKYAFVRNTIIYMYANCGFVDEARKLFDEDDGDVVSWNSMMLGLAKSGRVDECRRLFDKMGQRRTEISWNTMMSGYVRKGETAKAFELFGRMRDERIRPSVYTMVSLLNACAHLGSLEQGEWLYNYLCNNYCNLETNTIVVTAIINMLCKCGAIDKARNVFEKSSKKSLSCWNSMILGLANNGHEDEAIGLFEKLESFSDEMKPDGVTFLGVLMACVYSGDVKRGRDYFLLMVEKYEIKPTIKHYGCMVEGLGKAGLLDEAKGIIKTMPMKPDVAIWGSLLSASRMHGNVEMADLAAKHVKELDCKDSCAYVMMSNVLAASAEYESAVQQRVLMTNEGVIKERGGSSIQILGEVREFASGGWLQQDLMLLL